jgi:hypothetical protein
MTNDNTPAAQRTCGAGPTTPTSSRKTGTVAGWPRLGLYPNRDVAWCTAWIVGPDRPGVCSVNYQFPIPADGGLVVENGASRIALELLRPLESFRMAATAAELAVQGRPCPHRDADRLRPRPPAQRRWAAQSISPSPGARCQRPRARGIGMDRVESARGCLMSLKRPGSLLEDVPTGVEFR